MATRIKRTEPNTLARRLPIGAECSTDDAVHFRVWAPRRSRVHVLLDDRAPVELSAELGGYFSGSIPNARAGALYRYRLDGRDAFPDPASRFQPDGPHGPSQVIDPSIFEWTDAGWLGPRLDRAVLYELHVGTFTRDGTWAAAARELPELADAGITCIEIMPLAE